MATGPMTVLTNRGSEPDLRYNGGISSKSVFGTLFNSIEAIWEGSDLRGRIRKCRQCFEFADREHDNVGRKQACSCRRAVVTMRRARWYILNRTTSLLK